MTNRSSRFLLQMLESRVLFDAAPFHDQLVGDVPDLITGESATVAPAVVSEVVFVDASVEGYESLLDDLTQQAERALEVHLLRPGSDGVEQMALALEGRHGISALHIISHGDVGELYLGNAVLSSASMAVDYQDELATIGRALNSDGDILLYGCRFASGEEGGAAAQQLALATGADVAASEDLTGDVRQGGDWTFEKVVGDVQTGIALTADFQEQTSMLLIVRQEFFVPLTEQGIYDANEKILNEVAHGAVSTDTNTVIALTAVDDGAVIVFDHHEDGYEADLDNPTQATTEIWGDGDLTNGVAPGYATDVLSAGELIELENVVDITAVPDVTFDFDGGDRFGSDIGLAVTRAGWSIAPGTVLAGTVEVSDTSRWGNTYVSPIGEDTMLNAVYEYVSFFIQAANDGTTVDVDTDADGTVDITTTLARGETLHVDGGVLQGATVDASDIVQVDLITGDRDSSVDSRWYMIRPRSAWSNEYLNPATTTLAGNPGSIVLFNPQATSIDVEIETMTTTTTVTVAAGSTGIHTLPLDAPTSGSLVSSDDVFYAAFAMDTDVPHSAYDWGFSLIPTASLTEMVFSGWAPGSNIAGRNGSPIWVTANSDATLYVDFDGDQSTGALTDPFGNQYDENITLSRLESLQLFDTTDNDQSGMRIYTVDGTDISAAWGIDPLVAEGRAGFLDMGTVVLPFPLPRIDKTGALTTDVNGNGLADPGDVLTWTLTLSNLDINPLTNPTVFDVVPANTTYVPNSTFLDGVPVADDTVGATLNPIDETGILVPDVDPLMSAVIEFQTRLNDWPPIYDCVTNDVIVDSDQGTNGSQTTFCLNTHPLLLDKEIVSIDHASSGTASNFNVTYRFSVHNLDVMDIDNLMLTDDWATQFGANFIRIIPGSVNVTNIDATTAPTANAAYAGGAAESMISGGLLQSNQRFEVTVVVEVDPDADSSVHVLENLVNQATISGEDPSGGPLSDLSDDPLDTTDHDPDSDNEPDDPTAFTLAAIEVEKTAGTVAAATSGTAGNFDVDYSFTVTNTGISSLNNFTLTDDWATQFGSAFIRIVPGSVSVTNIDATTPPGANATYAGGAAENMLDGAGTLASGQSFQLDLTVEVDPDADPVSLVNGLLVNQATVTGNDSSGPIVDLSDDPTDATNVELDTAPDNDGDDPTTVGIPAISSTKSITSFTTASSGTAGNIDVTYDFVITNTGSLDLDNLSLVDDWATRYGGAFVRVVPASVVVTNVDSTTVPGANAAYSGGGAENMLDGSGLLEAGQSFQVRVVVEVDPDSATANFQPDMSLLNQATASGDDPSGGTVSDLTDDPSDATNIDPNSDNDPDDPNRLYFTDLVTVKTLASSDATPDEGDTVTFQIEVTNNGSAQATNVVLTDSLPSGLTATANNGTISQGSYNAATGVWNIGTLINGASATLTLEGTVDVGQGGNTITNNTTAAVSDEDDPSTAGDDLTESVDVNNDAALVTVKTLTSGDATPDEGDTVTFQIEVTNSGSAQATNVSLTDSLPAGLTANANNGNVSQGSYNAATGLWTIGTLDNGASATLTLEGTVDVGQGGNTDHQQHYRRGGGPERSRYHWRRPHRSRRCR